MENDNLTKNNALPESVSGKKKSNIISEFLINNSLYIFMITAIIAIAVANPRFLSAASIINIISLSAAAPSNPRPAYHRACSRQRHGAG